MRTLPALLICAGACAARAQVLEVRGGASTLYDGYGISTGVWGDRYDGWVGVGYQDRWRIGGFLRLRAPRDTIRIGNDALSLGLPTDVFGDETQVVVQGVTVSGARGSTRLLAFAGASATGLGVPLFAARRADQTFGTVMIRDSLDHGIDVGATGVIAPRSSWLGHARWRGADGSSLAASGGVSGRREYGAFSGSIRRNLWAFQAELVNIEPGFRRANLPIPRQTTLNGVNAELSIHPTERSFAAFTRHEYLTDSGTTSGFSRAHGISGAVGYSVDRGHVAAGVYLSRASAGRNLSAYTAAGWTFLDWLAADVYLMQSRFESGKPRTMPALMLHERASPRLTLDQVLTGFGRGASLGLGGTYLGRFGEYAVNYQIVNDPFDSRSPFKRAATVTMRLQLGDYNATFGTSMHADGRMYYTASAERYLYLGGMNGLSPAPLRVRMDRYVIEGLVRDEAGAPIGGAAISLGDDIVFTNSEGRFFTRVSRRRAVRVTVAFDQFIVLGTFSVVSAPETAMPGLEGQTTPVIIVLKRH